MTTRQPISFDPIASCRLVTLVSALILFSAAKSLGQTRPLETFPPAASLEEVQKVVQSASKVHPRLFADESTFKATQVAQMDNPFWQTMSAGVVQRAKWLTDVPPVQRELEGRRLLGVSRTCLQRVLTLAMAFRLTGDQTFVDRAEVEMLAAAEFEDWNPSHFLDVGEMTLALAIGYDWLYHELSMETRTKLRQAIVDKALRLPFETKHKGWVRATNNWGQVCHGGLVCGALAVIEDHPELAARTIKNATDNVVRSMHVFQPNGSYPEGPGYWAYGTGFNVVLIDVLESTLGTDFGLNQAPGFDQTGGYLALVTGPSGRTFNYSDGGSSRSPQSSLFWFAKRYKRGDWLIGETERVTDFFESMNASSAEDSKGRLLPLALLWYRDLSTSATPQLPLHWISGGEVPITIHRSGWEKNATFLGLKAGSPSANHGNMDIGSFVLDANGVRWALDLGSEGYHGIESRGMNLWDRSQGSDRWTIFRQSNLGHNTLVIDGQLQRASGFGKIAEFSAAEGRTIIDLSDVYRGQADSVRRTAQLRADGSVRIQDELSGLRPGARVRFAMITPGEPTSSTSNLTDTIELRQGDSRLTLQIDGPPEARWSIIETEDPPHDWDSSNPGTRMVAFEGVAPNDGKLRWSVTLTPCQRQ